MIAVSDIPSLRSKCGLYEENSGKENGKRRGGVDLSKPHCAFTSYTNLSVTKCTDREREHFMFARV